jgi:hypothetical protein
MSLSFMCAVAHYGIQHNDAVLLHDRLQTHYYVGTERIVIGTARL